MGQRTKWGNCSLLPNLSFNWRLIMAPEAVLRYLVTHEAVHLAVPDHSQEFRLTVRSLCPETGLGQFKHIAIERLDTLPNKVFSAKHHPSKDALAQATKDGGNEGLDALVQPDH